MPFLVTKVGVGLRGQVGKLLASYLAIPPRASGSGETRLSGVATVQQYSHGELEAYRITGASVIRAVLCVVLCSTLVEVLGTMGETTCWPADSSGAHGGYAAVYRKQEGGAGADKAGNGVWLVLVWA